MTDKPFSLSVRAVIFDAPGRCLLLRRSVHSRNFSGKWEWPGGKVDAGEDFAAAVIRETREETALEIAITGLAGTTQFEMPDVHVVVLGMECRLAGGALKLSREHDAFAWAPLPELSQWELMEQTRPFMLEYAARKGVSHENKTS